jgi:hypothetical protein
MFRALFCSALTSVVLCVGTHARADVVFDSFDPGLTFGQSNMVAAGALNGIVLTVNRMAVQFTAQGCGGAGFTLDSVIIPIARQASNSTSEVLRIRIAEDSGGLPGATLEVLSENQTTAANTSPFTSATTYASAAHPRLTSGHSYWVVAELTAVPQFTSSGASVNYLWYQNTSGAAVQASRQQRVNGLPQDPWPAPAANTFALRVNATAMPLIACCNPSTGACAVIDSVSCASLGAPAPGGVQTCEPNPCSPAAACPADFNHSGGLTVQDIFDYLAAWFAGCP